MSVRSVMCCASMDLAQVKDIEYLRQLAQVQKVQIQQLLRVLSLKCQELEALKGNPRELQQTLALLQELQRKAQASAPASEASAEGAGDDTKPPRPPQRGHGPTAQPNLPHVPETFELDEADRACPSCGGALAPLEGQFERSEMIDVIDAQYRVVQVQRQKYVCRCGGCVETAPGPERAVPGGRYSLAFAAKVVVDKYLDHLPLERQSRILARHGLIVSSQALWDQVWQIAQALRPVWEALRHQILRQPVIGVDQTGWPNLEKDSRAAWQMWCLTAPGLVYHTIRDDKSAKTFVDLLGEYQGSVVCDALSTHAAGARDAPGLTLSGCWAHVRRAFADVEHDFPEARIVLDHIRRLYDIEAQAESDVQAESEARRAQLRQSQSRAIVEQMRAWLLAQPALKTTSIGEAIRYTLGCWPRLVRFLENPAVWLDNNRTERALRGPVVGRRNHFGSKSRRGTEAAAILYSLLETAKLAGVDPAAYLAEAALRARRSPASPLLPADFARA
jgi:transposase